MKILERTTKLNIDEGLPQRVINTSLIVAALICLVSFSAWSNEVTLGLSIGMGTSIAFAMALIQSVKALAKAGKEGSKLFFTLISFSKFILLSAALIFTFKYLSVNYLALLAGIGLVQVVIVLKMVSIVMVNYLNKTDETENKETSNAKLQMTNK